MPNPLASLFQRTSVEKAAQAFAYGYLPGRATTLREDALGQPTDTNYDLLYALYELNPDISGAIDRWIGAVTGASWRIAPMDPNLHPPGALQQEIEAITVWLRRPHPSKHFFLLAQELIMDMGICGDAYWHVIRDANGKPVELTSIHPITLRIIATEHGEIVGYIQRLNRREVALFEADEIIHFRLPSRKNDLYGQSPLERLLEEVKNDLKAVRANQALFDNGLAPSAIALLENGMSHEEAKKAVAMIKQQHTGPSKRHQLMALLGIKDIKPWGSTLKDMEFIATRTLSTEKVATGYGVPKEFLNQKGASNYATADAMERQLYLGKGKTLQEITAELITEGVIHSFNPALQFVWNTPEFGDPDQLRRDALSAHTKGAIDANELRTRFFGLEARDEVEEEGSTDTDGQEQGADEATDAPAAKKLTKADTDREQTRVRRDATLEALSDGLRPAVVGYFADQRVRYETKVAEVFKQVTKAAKDDVAAYLSGFAEDDQQLAVLLKTELEPSITAGFAEASLQIGFSINTAGLAPAVDEFLTNHGLQHAKGINTTTREALRQTLLEGIQSGEGTPDLAARVRGVFAAASDWRAETIARTETAQAFEYANTQALKASGVVSEEEWLTARDERVRPTHAALEGKRVPLGKEWPGGIRPGEEINCRCTSIGIVRDKVVLPEAA